MGIRDYLKDPAGRRNISQAIRGAFDRKRGAAGRILVIDRDPLSREAMVRTLRRENYRVVGAADSTEAVDLFNGDSFDLVITDTRLAEGDETRALVALRQRSPNLKVLAVSPRAVHGQTARSCEANDTLFKPFDTMELLQAIKRQLQDS